MFSYALIGGAVVIGCVAVWLIIRAIRKGGEEKARRRQAETTADILERQRDAMADRPDASDPDDVLDRL